MKSLVEHRYFERLVLAAIFANAITLGLETVPSIETQYSGLLSVVDRMFIVLFTIEVSLKMWVYRLRFFVDPWRIFDLSIVAIAWVPTAGPFSVLRSLRILRALRLISTAPYLRRVVSGLLTSLPGLGAVVAIIVLIFYVASVMATKLFSHDFPQWFGDIASSAYSLFQIMTLESWSMGIVRPVMERFPYAWLFFVPFILVTTFTTLNLLVAVLVNAMQAETEDIAAQRAREGHDERQKLFDELKEIKTLLNRIGSK